MFRPLGFLWGNGKPMGCIFTELFGIPITHCISQGGRIPMEFEEFTLSVKIVRKH